MDSFFEEAEYPWTSLQPPPQSQGNMVGGEASGYLMDLMDFSSTVMMSVLIQLPEFAKDYVYRGTLKYCSMVLTVRLTHSLVSETRKANESRGVDGVQSFLTDKEPKMVSDQGLMWLAKDVRWLVDHIKSLQNENLLDVFSELYQVKAFPPTSSSPFWIIPSLITPLDLYVNRH